MSRIPFSEEWDKLKPEKRVVGLWFTTARHERMTGYYNGQIGKVQDIVLKGKVIGRARLLNTIIGNKVDDLDLDFWKQDTKADYTMDDVHRDMKGWYRTSNPRLVILSLEWTEVF